MSERAGDRDPAVFEGDGGVRTGRLRRRTPQGRTSLALVVVAVAALVAGLSWRAGLVARIGDDAASPTAAETSATESMTATASAAEPSASPGSSDSATPTPGDSASSTPGENPSPAESATPAPTPSPTPALTPGPTTLVTGPASPRMSCARHRSVAVKLADGRVLVAGGCMSDNDGKDANGNWIFGGSDIFDPATGKFTPTGKMTTTRDVESTLLLPDGRVFFIGGSTGRGGDEDSTEFFDPATGRFVPGPNTTVRGQPGLFLLGDGRVLVVGQAAVDPAAMDTAEIFDPGSATFRPAGRLPSSGVYGQMSGAVLPDGRVFILAFVISGTVDQMKMTLVPQFYDPATNKFSAAAKPARPRDGSECGVPLPNGEVAVIGGNTDGPVEVYDPAKNAYRRVAGMPKPLNINTCTKLGNGKILVLGSAVSPQQPPWTGWLPQTTGGLFDPRPAASASTQGNFMTNAGTLIAELYDPATGKWTLLGNTAQPRIAYSFNAVALDDGRALIVGGGANTGELFDPKTNRFTLLK